MGEVAGGVALATAEAAAPSGPPAAAPAPLVPVTAPASMSFVDTETPTDPAAAIIDEVTSGMPAEEAPAEGEPKTETATEDKPADAPKTEPAADAPPTNDVEAARLRKGFAKLSDERQKVIELQNAARAEMAAAQQYATKAQRHDEIVAQIEKDPAAFLLAHGGETLVQKALQGFIDQEKSPAEREVMKLRQESNEREAARQQTETRAKIDAWRNGVISSVQADERFDLINTLGLHNDVIEVITQYAEKHSERDGKGNITKVATLPWDTAAKAVEDQRAAMIEKSKRYGKRTPAAASETTPKKDAPPAKQQPAPAKKAPTSLSSVPVAETPSLEDDLTTTDLEERQRLVLAELGIDS